MIKGLATGGIVPTIVQGIVWGTGFTNAGVAAGSLAASFQSGMGGVIAAGSKFAILQSIGATSGLIAIAPYTMAIGGVSVAGYYIYKKIKPKL